LLAQENPALRARILHADFEQLFDKRFELEFNRDRVRSLGQRREIEISAGLSFIVELFPARRRRLGRGL
jgi:hypothetical protein